ncbi:MAG: hypothetical protein ACFB0G_03125 [Leptolyngbyaceae cyanobacterium]
MDIVLYEEVLFVYLFVRLPLVFAFSVAALGMEFLRSRLFGGRFYKPF